MNTNPQSTSSYWQTVNNFVARHQRGVVAAFFVLVVAVGAVTAISISSAKSEERERATSATGVEKGKRVATILSKDFGASSSSLAQEPQSPVQQPAQKVPTLTLQNAPVVAQCHNLVLNQSIIDMANAATEDPAVTFEKNRRLHPHMVAMPPTVECASGLWRAARRGGAPETPADPEIINQRQFALDSVFLPSPLAAAVGTNIDPANGVEGYQGETNISINPNNPNQIVAHSNTFFKDPSAACQSPTGGTASTFGTMALFGSSDGGATWTYKCAPWHTSVTGGISGANAWFGSDPALAWDNSGKAYACYMLLSEDAAGNAGAAIVLARSTDSGATWSQFGNPVVNRINLTTSFDDKEMFTIDNTSGQAHSFPGRMYVIWDEGNAERIAHSDDGLTWSTVTPSSNTGAIGGNVVVGADGTVYAIWTRYNVETLVFSKSTDGGATWTAPAVIATIALQSFGTNNTPPAQDKRGINSFGAIDVDRNPNSAFFGNLYVSFTDFPTGTTTGADLNAYMIRSTNGGTSWSTRVKVNDDNFGASQFFPWLAVDQSDGSVNMSWVDSRLDPLNRKTQMVYARSIDGGVSFEPNILVNDNGANWRNNVNYSDENSTDNTAYNGNQYGDYSGIAAINRQVHPLWTDSRMFFPTADTQSPTRREDNGTSTIVNCSAPTSIAAPTVNSSTTPSVAVSWSAPSGWGTNATNGTYSVYRNTTSTFPGGSPLASGLTATSYVDTTGVLNTTYFYFVRATNNCPGTALTPMTTDSAASASVVYGSAGTPTGVLQGTVTSGGSAVSGIVVSAGTYSAATNGSGFYQFPAINAGTYTVSASPAGYSPASVSGVVVNGGATTVQNLSLTANSGSSCLTDTSFADFSTGTPTNTEISTSPGDVKLTIASGGQARDQHADDNGFGSGYGFTTTSFAGQTFTPSVTASMTKVEASMFCASCSGTNPNVILELRTTSGGQPVMTAGGLLQSVSVPGFSSGSSTTVSFTFSTTLTAGVQYGIVAKIASTRTGTQAWLASNGDVYAGGKRVVCNTSSCSNPTGSNNNSDLIFVEYDTTPNVYSTTGNLISSVKDSGAVTGSTPNWTTLSWTNTLPASTSVQFQAAGSNSSSGPFNFVGPDGTASTFFTTSGASLSQFNGFRYLKYKAILSTSNTASTPTLSDVTVCYNNVPITTVNTTLTPSAATGTFGGTVNLSATLTDGTNPLSGKSISFTLNGNSVGSANTNGSGVASLTNVSLSGINAGSYPSGVGASFAGGGGYNSSSGTAALTVNKANQTISITTNAPSTAVYNSQFTVAATGGGSGNAVTFSNAGVCSNSGATFTMTGGTGTCTVKYDQAGNSNYNAATQATESVTAQKANTTTTMTANNASYDGSPHGGSASVTGTAGLNQSLTVTYTGRNTTVYGPSTTAPTNAGDYTASASYAGDSNYNSSSDSKDYSISKANQTITFNALADKTYGDADFGVSASASSGLTVSFAASGNCTVTGSTVHITGAGSCTITASQGGDSNYNAAADVARSFNIGKANQTITFGALTDKTYGDADFGVSASASSGLTVSFAASGNCTVTGSTVHITGAGSCTITASQGGDSNYNAAADVNQSFNIGKANTTTTVSVSNATYDGNPHGGSASVTGPAGLNQGLTVSYQGRNTTVYGPSTTAPTNAGDYTASASYAGDSNYNSSSDSKDYSIGKANQTITFGALADKTYGDADFNVNASASSGLAVSFSASGSCTVSGNTVHITGGGSCTITASQGGDGNYNAAANVDQSFNIAKANQTITFGALADKTYGDADFQVSASASSGLAVSFGASGNCTVTGDMVHITGAGSCTITASQGGDSNYNAASDVPRSFNIAKANQTITFGTLSDKTYGDADFQVSASASSGLAVSFGASGNCTVTGDMVHITGAGSCTITASQAGDSNYNAASDVARSFNIAKANQTITFGTLSDKTYGDADFQVSASASSGLAVSFGASGNCTVTGSTVHITGAGSCTITASQAGDSNYNAAPDVPRSFNIAKANQTITFGALSDKTYGDADFQVSASASSELAVSFGASGNCTVTGDMVHITGAGSCTITASQVGDGNYNAAPDVPRSFNIAKATPAITWSNPADIIYGTALSGTQLNASGSVPGSFVYTPAAGTVLGYGNGQNLHAAFTPTDTANYNGATKDVTINVLSALLTTTMTVDRNPALVGYNHNYLIAITNNGNAPATSMTLSDPLPTQVRFTAVTTSQGVCSYDSGTHTVNCTLGTLGIGSTINIQLTTKTMQTGTLNNTATVNASQWDPATGGNTASVNGLQAIALTDVSISNVDSPDPIAVTQNTTYTIVVKNYNTPINATGVVMTDNLPASFQFVSATTTQGSLVTPPVGSTGIVTANIGTLAVNGTATITITVKGTAGGTFTNTASVTENENDSNTANNSAGQSTTVNAPTLQKVLLASQVLIGGCQNTTGNVYLTAAAPAGGFTVNLSTTSLAGVTVPASVFIAQGQTVSPAFSVTTSPVATKQVGTVNATLGSTTVSRGLTVNVGSGSCPP